MGQGRHGSASHSYLAGDFWKKSAEGRQTVSAAIPWLAGHLCLRFKVGRFSKEEGAMITAFRGHVLRPRNKQHPNDELQQQLLKRAKKAGSDWPHLGFVWLRDLMISKADELGLGKAAPHA